MEFIAWSLLGFVVALLLTLGLKALELSVHWRAVMAGAYALAIAAVAFSIVIFTGWTTRGGWLLGCALGWLFGGLWVDDLLWRVRHGRSESKSLILADLADRQRDFILDGRILSL